MPRKSELTTANLVDHLTELHGPEIDVVQVRNAADHFGVSYDTASKRLDSYKSGRGKWNLTAQEIQQAYEADQVRGAIFSFFSILTLFLTFLGLFGLTAFLASQRIKEIGVRKILGARLPDLILLISRDFLILNLLAAIPAFLLAWYTMQQWLQNFAFREAPNITLLGLVLLLTLLLTLITSGGQVIWVGRRNPAETLKQK